MHLNRVLARLQEYELFVKASKTKIAMTGTDFVGYWISAKGIHPLPLKTRAILNWKPLENVTDVHSFLWMASFYKRYVHRYAHLATSLYELTVKDAQWQFGPRQEEAFESLKFALINSPILILLDPEKPYVVVTNAMDTAVGGTLM